MAWSGDEAVVARIGENLRGLREARGIERSQLAAASGYHRTYLADIERGERNPSSVVIARLALHLGVDPGDLLEGTVALVSPVRPDRRRQGA